MKIKRTTVHISDDTGRIAMLETRTFGLPVDDDETDATLTRYIYSNHLQSASLELNGEAEIISYEEYHPYGTTAYQAKNDAIKAVAKRYRYTGKERDEESGLYYHGARYYVPWLCRWCASDPLESKYAPLSPYNYCENNPVMMTDPSGMGPGDSKEAPVVHGILGDFTANYTFISNTYDHNRHLVSSTTTNTEGEIKGLAHGEYVTNTYLPDPSRPVIRDGNIVVANLSSSSHSFTPFATQEQSLSQVGKQIWDSYKMVDPIQAGKINGTWNFITSTLSGLWQLGTKPEEVLFGLAKFAYYMQPSAVGDFSESALNYKLGLAMSLDQTWAKFRDGDTYTKSSMGTEAALTIGSFFVGGGEARVVGEIGWTSKSLKVAEAETKCG